MFVPKIYRDDEGTRTRALLRGYPLATLMTAGPRFPQATHVPIIMAPGSPADGELAGTTLLGHMNRANPHWRWLEDGVPAKLVFTGPHGYVSPTAYRTTPAAPTWNFLTVHVEGTLRPVYDIECTLEIVRQTAHAYEREFGAGWDPEFSLDYFRSIVKGVGAFAVEIERVDTMFKLSQEKSPEVQDQVIAWFDAAESGTGRDLGRAMRTFGAGTRAAGHRWLSLWGGPAGPPCLLESVTESAVRRPGAIAVVDERRELTYAALLAWAGDIAALLASHDVGEGDRVAVAGDRSSKVVAAMLAVVSLGATYIPLDNEYPRRRLEHMLKDSAPKVLLHAGPVPELDTTAAVVPVAEPGPAPMADGLGRWSPVPCQADLPVYVIYTSGSTGWPKGVAIQHRCLDNMVEWQRSHSVRPDLRTAQFAPLNFDVCFQEILGTLAGGGTLCVVPERMRSDSFELLDWLVAQHVERLFLPYLALHMLAVAATAGSPQAGLALVEINTAGEQIVCSPPIREFFARFASCRLNNHYGQSESAMVTAHTLSGPSSDWPAQPPIGVPLPGCEVLVDPVDPAEPEVGELLVAGLPVSLGYLNQPDLNARRYVDIDRTPQGHIRAFRTGDLVRLDGGVIQFLNRVDNDVKIRGVRVNLMEVDAALLEQPGVAEAMCVVVEGEDGTRRLHAALTGVAGMPPPDRGALTATLREVLPAVSVPLSLHVLPALPVGASGKIDRAAVTRKITQRLKQRPGHGGHLG
ncbi:AMP-binding protein [Nonomuraea sp. NPDC049758]|uniref:AMP-binding protein n=1 Tax=Nonomuraea sp. NPDC049758 TaxID=3154360 RepID=UPI00344743AD